MWLTAEADRTRGVIGQEILTRRAEILKLMRAEDREVVMKFIDQDHSRGNVGSVRVLWKERPHAMFLNGFRVNPEEAEGKTLVVAAGGYTVIAQNGSHLAYAHTFVISHDDLELDFGR